VIQPTYDAVVYPFTGYKLPRTNTIDTMAYVKLGEERFFINTKGVRVTNLPKGYDYDERVNAPIEETSIMDDEQEAIYKKKREAEFSTDATTGKKGLVDQSTGTVLVPPQYDNIRKIYTDDAPLSNLYCVELNKKYGVINSKGTMVLPLECDFVEGVRYIDRKGNYYFSAMKDKELCVIDNHYKVIISGSRYISAGGTNERNIGMYIGRTDKLGYLYDFEKQKFLNKKGFENIGNAVFEEGLMKVGRDGKTFYVDVTGVEFVLK